ncbi:RNA-binding domain-containing protein [Vulcanisaeta sp. JCM 16161]|uniref:RNA-binding domain-containing protein n=1 Tax=Vulcanisaeta sp. JCM 16161 TaxID=1295372 RepID=UPI0006D125C3|nr:RNA-binding domain-containing protein [Vulcanisaeta sp. JCM 16161]
MINPIEHIEISTHVHATESELKVVRALLNLLPPQYRDGINIARSSGQGHFGNDINTIKVQFRGQDALEIARYILRIIDQLDREIILVTINSRFDDGKLYLRFNKQLAYNGVVRLDDGDDVIKVIMRFNHWVIKNEGIENVIRQLMAH